MNNIRTNGGHIVCLLHNLAEPTGLCKLYQINAHSRGNDTDWHKRRLISKLYMDHTVKL